MTTKEFFVATVTDERPRFERVLKAVPGGKLDYRPDAKSRTALDLVKVFAVDAGTFAPFLKTGTVDISKIKPLVTDSVQEITSVCLADLDGALTLVSSMSEEDWAGEAKMVMGENEEWKTTKANMAWGLLLDLIHHRGQLSTYIRPMGGKVPSIYGPSADSNS